MTHPFVKTDYPQLELPNWLPRPVAEQAERLYDLELAKDPKYRPPHVAESMPQPLPPASGKRPSSVPSCVPRPSERVRRKLDELKRSNDPLNQRFSEDRPFSQEQRSRLIASLKVLCRLTSDQRMNRVWREVYKKSRSDPTKFVHPVMRKNLIFDKITSLHDPKNQDEAVQAFLFYAFILRAWAPRLLRTQAEVDSRLKPFHMTASRLREDAENLRALGLDKLATDVEVIAAECENRAYKPKPNIFFPAVDRRRGDQVVRSFALRLSEICLQGFEKALPGIVAITASVVFSKEITGGKVREMVRAGRRSKSRRGHAVRAASRTSGAA
jgi:hypothetical protein